MLSSPIILYDYPRIAPESLGDFFDGSEIDQMLLLNVITLTDDEKAEMRASDPRARAILERSESLTPQEFMRLNGAMRDIQVLRPEFSERQPEFPALYTEPDIPPQFAALEQPVPDHVTIGGVAVQPGSRVRLRPRPGRDVWDVALAGKVAFVESIEQDYEERIHLAVTLEDDPGRDLGRERFMGHRFSFAPDEIEPLSADGDDRQDDRR